MGERHNGRTMIGAADGMELATRGFPITSVEVGRNHRHATRVATHDDVVGQLLGLHMDVKC